MSLELEKQVDDLMQSWQDGPTTPSPGKILGAGKQAGVTEFDNFLPLKVATWNLNGLRARHTQLLEWQAAEKPDVICLQEIRVSPPQIPPEVLEIPGFHSFWHCGPKGYSGVAIHLSNRLGDPTFSHPPFDFESRVVCAEVGNIEFYSVYVPNGGKDFEGKMRFLEALDAHLAERSAAGRLVILCGDLNVTRSTMDVHPKELKPRAVGQLPVEREIFERILGHGYVDVQRALHPDDGNLFTWWAPWRNMRERNIGWRIDYIVASKALAAHAVSCISQREVGTSDHAPVLVTFQAVP